MKDVAMHPQPSLRTTHTSGPLVYDRWGGYGRPILLLHGLLFDRTMWWPVAAELAGCGTVVAPDLPGHGESPPRADVSLPRLTEDLAALVHGLDLRRAPVVVGHGTAALLAVAFADNYATRHVITVDEPDSVPETVDDLIAAAHPEDAPEIFRDYARPRRDPVLLNSYDSWRVAPPIRRREPVPPLATRSAGGGPGCFAHLTDPAEFAIRIRSHL
jgi:pimeloyl-ACP methyl ester carboxylesterase